VEVDRRGVQAPVTEKDLDGPQIDPGLEEVSGEGVAQGVARDVLADPAAFAALTTAFWMTQRRADGPGFARKEEAFRQ
jgi:hypothetical protein